MDSRIIRRVPTTAMGLSICKPLCQIFGHVWRARLSDLWLAQSRLVAFIATADYGPETKAAREQLRRTVATQIEDLWPEEKTGASGLAAVERTNGLEAVQMTLLKVMPTTDAQRQLFAAAQQICGDLRQTRWLLVEQSQSPIPIPFLVVLLFWLTVLHVSFGMLAPRNATVVAVLLICALSVSGAIFMILEMSHPLDGIIKVSSAPMRKALEHLGQ